MFDKIKILALCFDNNDEICIRQFVAVCKYFEHEKSAIKTIIKFRTAQEGLCLNLLFFDHGTPNDLFDLFDWSRAVNLYI